MAGRIHGRASDRPLLVVGYLHHGVVVPLAWTALGKRGSSSQDERIALLTRLLERLPAERISALRADREFPAPRRRAGGKDFLRWLDDHRIGFVVRFRKNAWVERVRSGTAYQAGPLFALIRDGARRRLRGKWRVYGVECYVTATREAGSTWMLISNRHPNQAAVLYGQRSQTTGRASCATGTLYPPRPDACASAQS